MERLAKSNWSGMNQSDTPALYSGSYFFNLYKTYLLLGFGGKLNNPPEKVSRRVLVVYSKASFSLAIMAGI